MKKFVYLFSEGSADKKSLLGGKGANLCEMKLLGLPVPDGFIVSTEACADFYKFGQKVREQTQEQIFKALAVIEKTMGKKFGEGELPLLVSVRSGSRASMPGMMDTVLNLGMCDGSCESLAKINPRFAYDSYRRFIQMFANVVMGLDRSKFEKIIDEIKAKNNIIYDSELNADDLKDILTKYKALYKTMAKEEFPQNPREQLMRAVSAVFKSWQNPRAVVYRRLHDIPSSWGTAVSIQAMVFGNIDQTCGTGVAFSRNPSSGENKLYGEYLLNAQGEDVVAGIRTPNPIEVLKEQSPKLFEELMSYARLLETRYKDMQDMEFTIERGKLYMLQTRNGKRTGAAALKIAVDMVEEGLKTEKEALLGIDPKQLDSVLHPQFEKKALSKYTPIASGLPASPGAACGKICFDVEKCKQMKAQKIKSILVRLETSPEDIEGMNASEGILTVRGGMTSHAAVVARGMGRACVVGCSDLRLDEENKQFEAGGKVYREGDDISIDGSTGHVYGAALPTVEAEVSGDFAIVLGWANKYRKLKVRANADTKADAETALRFGAEGIGLTRTEHMFFKKERIMAIREMIVSSTEQQRKAALDKILPYQREDFEQIFRVMNGKPVTIRLIDPPLHEFVPHEDMEIKELAKEMKLTYKSLKQTVQSLHEFNPMMGHRGCRLIVTFPEIAVMQTQAIIEAAVAAFKAGIAVHPEIMVPLVMERKEFRFVHDIIKKTADEVLGRNNVNIEYTVGTMIEVPRAALLADEIAKEAEFFSFGTNDLTQMTFGFSRDDIGKFIGDYYSNNILDFDPFAKIDFEGVGQLMTRACERGKKVRPNIELGICGEHGGDPASIKFCHTIGLHYVSCSPFRVPVAILAAAQAALSVK
ncbi:MAG: pyruvate, phosphate dikinase [Christensenellaceae bacterium]|jgi:pyruvate,orthophosphate dikinase|nr:pyruvate, phosphate dikinase [Christensenellaceae bacterium]